MRTRTEILRDIKKVQPRIEGLKADIDKIRGRMRGADGDAKLVDDAARKTDELNEAEKLLSGLHRELELRKRKGARYLRKKVTGKKK